MDLCDRSRDLTVDVAEGGAAGRTYAGYAAVYLATAIVWHWLIEGHRPTATDLIGASVCLVGMGIIIVGARAV